MRPDIRRPLAACTLAAALLMTGCSTVQVGSNFDLSAFESGVQYGVTTKQEVREWLGPPTSTGISVDANGRRFQEWTYYYGTGKLPNMKAPELKFLQVRFDQQDVVRGYNWSGNQ
jgi:outer membrane protein assembly factor BamE (lipoprotein component of BamABCDE complex)